MEHEVEAILQRSVVVSQMLQQRSQTDNSNMVAILEQQQRDISILYDLLQNERQRTRDLEQQKAAQIQPYSADRMQQRVLQLVRINNGYGDKIQQLLRIVQEMRARIACVARDQDTLFNDYARVRAAHVLCTDVEFRDEQL